MKKTVFVLFVLCFIFQFQIQAQSNEVEVYIVHSDSILKGAVVNSSQDSLTIQMDSATFISFAKTELQGRDLAVSKEIKDLRKRLLKKEYNIKSPFADFPGSYQIKHGSKAKGYVMAGFATVFIAGALVVTPIWITANGLNGFLLLFATVSGVTISSSLYMFTSFLSNTDQYNTIKKIIYNRYYYTGTRY